MVPDSQIPGKMSVKAKMLDPTYVDLDLHKAGHTISLFDNSR